MAHPQIASGLLRRIKLEKEAREMRECFPLFAEKAWYQFESSTLVTGWFWHLLCEELEKWGRREPGHTKKIICVPPRSGKTAHANVMLPSWIWTFMPGLRFMAYASGLKLASDSSRYMLKLVQSQWYQERFCMDWEIDRSQHSKIHFANTAHGQRFSAGGKAALTGFGGEARIVDDAIDVNPRNPLTAEKLEAAREVVHYLLMTRSNELDLSKYWDLVIAQRVHEDDPPGMLLKAQPGVWSTVYFDGYYDPRMPYRHPKDPRRIEGEPLQPERGQKAEDKASQIAALGEDTVNSQIQQMPAKAGGAIVKESWLQLLDAERFDADSRDCPYTIISWDCAFKGDATSSWVVGSVWRVADPEDINRRRFYLVDLVRDHLDYGATKMAIERLALRYPEADYIAIEDKANGPAAISEMKASFPAIVAFNPNPYGDKAQRLRAVSPIFQQGRVFLPKDAPWLAEYIYEITHAPKISDWDQVDSTTQCMLGCQYHLEEWRESCQGSQVEVYSMEW